MSDIAIRAEGLSKLYRIGEKQERYKTLRDTLADIARSPLKGMRSNTRSASSKSQQDNTVWALKDVSFEIKHGEIVGIIGRNGAGKSTLLKVLSRITEPTEGFADIDGRIGSLLEVGTGFHPELTGRENIYLSGSILGMRREEINRKFDEIVDFAEVEKFIDTAVKHYSSGMYLRLAFAVAAFLEPDILLVDEVLAVGDAAFQKKCLGKMGDVANEGRTVLFVSHNLVAVETLCKRGIVLQQGQVSFAGSMKGAVNEYTTRFIHEEQIDVAARIDRNGSGLLRFESVKTQNNNIINNVDYISVGSCLVIDIELSCNDEFGLSSQMIDLAIIVRDLKGQVITTFANFFTGECSIPRFIGNRWSLRCEINYLPLLPGEYTFDLWCARGPELIDFVSNAYILSVSSGPLLNIDDARKPVASKHGPIFLPQRWLE